MRASTWSNLVANRLSDVTIAPFGPSSYLRQKKARESGLVRARTNAGPALCCWPAGREVVLLHDVFVVDRLAHVNVGLVRHVGHGRVEVDHVRHLAGCVNVRVQPLQRCICRARTYTRPAAAVNKGRARALRAEGPKRRVATDLLIPRPVNLLLFLFALLPLVDSHLSPPSLTSSGPTANPPPSTSRHALSMLPCSSSPSSVSFSTLSFSLSSSSSRPSESPPPCTSSLVHATVLSFSLLSSSLSPFPLGPVPLVHAAAPDFAS